LGIGLILSMWPYDEAREWASERVLSAFDVKFMAFGPDMIAIKV